MGQRFSRSIWNATQIDVIICETKVYVIEDAPKLPSFMDNCEFSSFYIALSNSSNKTNRLIISCGRFRNPSRSIRASQNENNQCTSWLNQYTTRINITKFDREVNMFWATPRPHHIWTILGFSFLFMTLSNSSNKTNWSWIDISGGRCQRPLWLFKASQSNLATLDFHTQTFHFPTHFNFAMEVTKNTIFRSRTFFFQFCHPTIVLCTKICDQFFPLDFVFPGEKRANQNFSLSQVSDKRKEHLSLKRWICYDNRMQ